MFTQDTNRVFTQTRSEPASLPRTCLFYFIWVVSCWGEIADHWYDTAGKIYTRWINISRHVSYVKYVAALLDSHLAFQSHVNKCKDQVSVVISRDFYFLNQCLTETWIYSALGQVGGICSIKRWFSFYARIKLATFKSPADVKLQCNKFLFIAFIGYKVWIWITEPLTVTLIKLSWAKTRMMSVS